MKVERTALPGVLVLEPRVFGDARGWFLESWNRRVFREATGVEADFVQDNHSRSARGVLRGLHYQLNQPQGKLVRVVAGEIYDVAVDLRRGSPGFGRSVGVKLDAESHRMLWVPERFAARRDHPSQRRQRPDKRSADLPALAKEEDSQS